MLNIFFHLISSIPLGPDWCYVCLSVSLLPVATPNPLDHLLLHKLELVADPLISWIDPQSDLQIGSGLTQVPQQKENLCTLLVGLLVHRVDLETLLAIEQHVVQKAQYLVRACQGEQGRRSQLLDRLVGIWVKHGEVLQCLLIEPDSLFEVLI